jgi:GNAT superfamily N-acetyltransferase
LIRAVSYAEILAHPDLIAEYAAECSIPEIGQVNPQAEMYAAMEHSGMMQAFGAFHAEQLVGFATILKYVIPHYNCKAATVESLFVAKEFRGTSAGISLMKAIEKHAKESDCQVISYSAPTGSQLEKLLTRLRLYKRTNSIFLRKL